MGPPALGPDDLILSHFSLGRFLAFDERVRAAAQAGFAAMGFYVGDYLRLRDQGHSDAELRAVLDDHGMRVVELEALRGWSASGGSRDRYLAGEDALFRMNDAVGPARTVQVVGPYEGSLDSAVESFASLCDRVGTHGLSAAIEFLPEMSNIPDAATALEIVSSAGRDNGGLCVDSWHHCRGAHDPGMLGSVPPERVFTVQINDGPAGKTVDDYYTDCTHYRKPPGQGTFDLTAFLQLLRGMGVSNPLSVEVLSDELLARPSADVAGTLARCTREVMRAAALPAAT